jgi:hypothetical protein
MSKILSGVELGNAIRETNAQKGYPIHPLCDLSGSYVSFRVLKPVGSFRQKGPYLENPHKLLKELRTLPDRPTKGLLGLLVRFF